MLQRAEAVALIRRMAALVLVVAMGVGALTLAAVAVPLVTYEHSQARWAAELCAAQNENRATIAQIVEYATSPQPEPANLSPELAGLLATSAQRSDQLRDYVRAHTESQSCPR